MNNLFGKIALFCCVTTIASTIYAQHSDVLVQDLNDRLTTGTADVLNGNWFLGARVYEGEFDSNYAVNDPGWFIIGEGSPDLPPGSEELPHNTDLLWDFLPMKIDGTLSNLFYWDGSGSVQFGTLPTVNYELSLQGLNGLGASEFFEVDGSPTIATGGIIDDTSSIGAMHTHRFFFLDDGDGDLGTDPADGIYLFSVRMHIQDLDRSMPIFFLFGTPGSTSTALSAADAWVNSIVDDLAPDYSADFDGDLDVNSSDLDILQQGFGTTGSTALQINGDTDYNDTIDGADFLGLYRQFGDSLSSFAGVSSPPLAQFMGVPEPSSLLLLGFGTLLTFSGRRVVGQFELFRESGNLQ